MTTTTETHRVESWSVNFRGERCYADEFYGTRAECEAQYAQAVAQERAPWSPWSPGCHYALRALGSNRVLKHNGPKGFNHSTRTAIYV